MQRPSGSFVTLKPLMLLIPQHRCKKRVIRDFFRQNGVDRASIDEGLDGR